MKILGALLAGGKSERFGSDKAFAIHKGQYLIDHAIGLLQQQSDAMLICGRSYKDYDYVYDDPMDQGPLGGLNAALIYAKRHGFDAVISFPCDTIMGDTIMGEAGFETAKNKAWFIKDSKTYHFKNQPVIGYWPVTLSENLEAWLGTQNRRSMQAWTEHIESINIDEHIGFVNINRPNDLKS